MTRAKSIKKGNLFLKGTWDPRLFRVGGLFPLVFSGPMNKPVSNFSHFMHFYGIEGGSLMGLTQNSTSIPELA